MFEMENKTEILSKEFIFAVANKDSIVHLTSIQLSKQMYLL